MTPANEKDFARSETGQRANNRVTATEVVGEVECIITLEQDDSGCYREIKLTPLTRVPSGAD